MLRFSPNLVLKTKRKTNGAKIFINILRGWIEEENEADPPLDVDPQFMFSSEPGFILASKGDPRASNSEFYSYDIVLCESLFKCLQVERHRNFIISRSNTNNVSCILNQNNQEMISDFVFRSIINRVSRLYSLPDLHTSTYSFPKFKLRQYKSVLPFTTDNRVLLDPERDLMNLHSICNLTPSEISAYLSSAVPQQVDIKYS